MCFLRTHCLHFWPQEMLPTAPKQYLCNTEGKFLPTKLINSFTSHGLRIKHFSHTIRKQGNPVTLFALLSVYTRSTSSWAWWVTGSVSTVLPQQELWNHYVTGCCLSQQSNEPSAVDSPSMVSERLFGCILVWAEHSRMTQDTVIFFGLIHEVLIINFAPSQQIHNCWVALNVLGVCESLKIHGDPKFFTHSYV